MDEDEKIIVPYQELTTPMNDYRMLCRGCLAQSGEMKNMSEWGLTEDFYRFTNIKTNKDECISELLCSSCEHMLQNCKQFMRRCQQSNLLLKSKIKMSKEKKFDSDMKMDHLANEVQHKIVYRYNGNKLHFMITTANTESRLYLPCPYGEEYQCEQRFLKKKYLLGHLVKAHGASPSLVIQLLFYCSYQQCPYNIDASKKHFSERKFLNQHYNKVHKSKLFGCDECRQSFATTAEFNRHLKCCNVSFSCDLCNVQYKNHERLLVHLMRKHPALHAQYKTIRTAKKRLSETVTESKRTKLDSSESDDICDSLKRSSATQTLNLEEYIKNDLVSWQSGSRTDEISTQTVFEDLLSLKSQASEDESLFFSETVSLSDIQTQTFPLEIGSSRLDKETETQSEWCIKETQTCFCQYDSSKIFDNVSVSSLNCISAETQTGELKSNVKSDVMLSFSSTETQTYFDSARDEDGF